MVCSLVFALIVGIYFYPRKKRSQIKTRRMTRDVPEELAPLDVPREDIVCNAKIGQGRYGDAMRAVLSNYRGQEEPLTVTVNRCTQEDLIYDFFNEAAKMVRLANVATHENVLKVVAVCSQRAMPFVLTEHMPNKGIG